MTDIGVFLGTEEITESARDVMGPPRGAYPTLAPEVAPAPAVAVTERVRVGYGVLLAAVRPLPPLAKEMASLQTVSRGRLLVGAGDGRGPWERWHGGAA